MSLEILTQDIVGAQINVHPLGRIQRTELAAKDESIKTAQDATDKTAKTL
jgi:hypothetical protein